MLKELKNLSIESDGRYASSSELQFLKSYLETAEKRISAYEKIKANQEEIIEKLEEQKHKVDPTTMTTNSEYYHQVCKKNSKAILRYSTASMLVNDLDHLRDVLLWYKTIVRAFNYEKDSQTTYKVLQDVIQSYLTPEEAKLVLPFFELDIIMIGF